MRNTNRNYKIQHFQHKNKKKAQLSGQAASRLLLFLLFLFLAVFYLHLSQPFVLWLFTLQAVSVSAKLAVANFNYCRSFTPTASVKCMFTLCFAASPLVCETFAAVCFCSCSLRLFSSK